MGEEGPKGDLEKEEKKSCIYECVEALPTHLQLLTLFEKIFIPTNLEYQQVLHDLPYLHLRDFHELMFPNLDL